MTPTGYKFGLRLIGAGSRKGDVGDDISPVTQDFEPHLSSLQPRWGFLCKGFIKGELPGEQREAAGWPGQKRGRG